MIENFMDDLIVVPTWFETKGHESKEGFKILINFSSKALLTLSSP